MVSVSSIGGVDMKRVEFFVNTNLGKMERDIKHFIKDKNVVDIQYRVKDNIYTAMILYEIKDEETDNEPKTEEPPLKEHNIRRSIMYKCSKKLLYPPNNFIPYNCDRTEYKTEVVVDACLADEIEDLWSMGIRTMGCCCGHGRHLGMIQVLPEDIKKMIELGYDFYNYKEDINRVDSFIPKSYGHDYKGYTDSYLG